MKKKTIEDTYKVLTDREHILLRPGTYVGSTVPETRLEYVPLEGRLTRAGVTYAPAALKLFDEIFSNSVDEYLRDTSRPFEIKVTADTATGRITIYDNGGIPVEKHKGTGKYVPEMVFSMLRAGSNFDDSDKREWVGTNGLGSTLVNIFSKEFSVTTCDGKNTFSQVWYDNGSRADGPKVRRGGRGRHFTEVSWLADWGRFGTEMDEMFLLALRKRVCDAGAYLAGRDVTLSFNGDVIRYDNLADYCSLYDDARWEEYNTAGGWRVAVAVSKDPVHVCILNGACCPQGGTVQDAVEQQVCEQTAKMLSKRLKADIVASDVRNCLGVVMCCSVSNPAYSSQTKERVITPRKNFEADAVLSEKVLRLMASSELGERVAEEAERRDLRQLKTLQRKGKTGGKGERVEKHIEASGVNDPRRRGETVLILCEGDSPITGLRKFRDPVRQGGFPLRGKSLNVNGVTAKRVLENQELRNIMTILGLEIGTSPFTYKDGKVWRDTMRYHEIHIYTDADVDGTACAALLVNFFYTYWPELFREHRIARCETPVLMATTSRGVKKRFYYQDEYDAWAAENKGVSAAIEYFKGLGSLPDEEYKMMVQTPQLYYYTETEASSACLDDWFGADSEKRKASIFDTTAVREVRTKMI